MSCHSGPDIINNGLVLALDAGNIRSNRGRRSMINWDSWAAGTGSVSGYPITHLVSENTRALGTDPFGNSSMLWIASSDGANTADGGWDTGSGSMSIDPLKLYRYSCWFCRTSTSTSGNYYMGLHTNGTGDVLNLSNGASETNPYWQYGGIGGLSQNVWYLMVGHIFPWTWPGTTAHPTSGVYTIANGKISGGGGNIPTDCKFPSNATAAGHRTFFYYCTDTTSLLQFFQPRVDLCDGTEPTIQELLTDVGSTLYDMSGKNNHHKLTSNPPYTSGQFVLDGSTQGFTRANTISGVSTTNSVLICYSTTDTTELWVRGNQNNAYYLSASASNTYYHSGCGAPSNYVDLKAVSNPVSEGYRNGAYHIFEAKNVDLSSWTYYEWFLYPGSWQMAGSVKEIFIYDHVLSAGESAQNFQALRGRYGL